MKGQVSKKNLLIFTLLVLLAFFISFFGSHWYATRSNSPSEEIPYNEVYERTEFFHGYRAFIDRDISFSIVQGTSMEPTFGGNDIILWVKADPSELKVGDIIIYKYSGKTFAHRIIDIKKNDGYRFETKGDNRKKSDAKMAVSAYLLKEEHLKGLVIGVIYSKNSLNSSSDVSWSKMKSLNGRFSLPTSRWTKAETWRL